MQYDPVSLKKEGKLDTDILRTARGPEAKIAVKLHKPRNAKDCRQLPEAKREAWGTPSLDKYSLYRSIHQSVHTVSVNLLFWEK